MPQTLLLIEDDTRLQALLVQYLEPFGFRVEACSDGPAGLAALDECSPDLVILDIMLPGMNGLQALELLRAREEKHQIPPDRRVPVIITTDLDDDHTASRAFIHGQAVAYITKPFQVSQIIEELTKLGLTAP